MNAGVRHRRHINPVRKEGSAWPCSARPRGGAHRLTPHQRIAMTDWRLPGHRDRAVERAPQGSSNLFSQASTLSYQLFRVSPAPPRRPLGKRKPNWTPHCTLRSDRFGRCKFRSRSFWSSADFHFDESSTCCNLPRIFASVSPVSGRPARLFISYWSAFRS